MGTERASDVAFGLLEGMILDLRLAPGAFINEQSLADELGLGRMPVREALARLAKDRFVTILPRRGIVVTPLALDDVLDMFEAREAIECGVAYIAATRATTKDLATLRQLVTTVNEARLTEDPEQFLTDDHEVHTFLVHMIRNPCYRMLPIVCSCTVCGSGGCTGRTGHRSKRRCSLILIFSKRWRIMIRLEPRTPCAVTCSPPANSSSCCFDVPG